MDFCGFHVCSQTQHVVHLLSLWALLLIRRGHCAPHECLLVFNKTTINELRAFWFTSEKPVMSTLKIHEFLIRPLVAQRDPQGPFYAINGSICVFRRANVDTRFY